MTCFVTDLMRLVVVSSMIDFFMGFYVDSSSDKVQYNKVIISNHIRQYIVNL